jgi:D-beta-D-heptose 7-phosphate kinase/D-beta-D-heptose 1-phosphate adenosyltransferase
VELTTDRLQDLLGRMHGRRIAVVGDAILDRYLIGDSERLSPEAPVPVVTVSERRASPGGAANVAANLAALGAVPVLVAVVGDDSDGAVLRQVSREAGFDAGGLLPINQRPTTVKTRVIARGQQVVRIDEEEVGELHPTDAERLLSAARAAIESADAVILEDYNKGVLTPATIPPLIAAAQARPIPILVDPRYYHFFSYRGATVFKPNRRELATALGPGVDLGSAEALRAAVARLGVEHLLLTLGGEGMLLVEADGRSERIPARAREVFDLSGAGDTVAAWCAAALGAGATVLEAAALANLAAGVEVGKAGVATVGRDEVLAAGQVTGGQGD